MLFECERSLSLTELWKSENNFMLYGTRILSLINLKFKKEFSWTLNLVIFLQFSFIDKMCHKLQ